MLFFGWWFHEKNLNSTSTNFLFLITLSDHPIKSRAYIITVTLISCKILALSQISPRYVEAVSSIDFTSPEALMCCINEQWT